jgi:leukotriene-A4 hydrolase
MAVKDPHSYTDVAQGRTAAVDLKLTVDFAAKRLHGQVTLTLVEPAKGRLDLDTRGLRIDAVTDERGASVPFSLGKPDPILGARLEVRLAQPSRTLTVRYATSPEASALQWLEPQHTAGGKHPYLFSQCQPHHARAMVPLQDSAMVRFKYKAEITVPKPLVAVMSAAPGARVAGPDTKSSTYAFEMPQPIPSYLLALAVGNLAAKDLGPRSRVYTEPEMLKAAAWEFAGVDDMLLAAEKLFGPYRWDRYDFLVMPPAFPYGGMENPRLTFLTPTLVAGDRSMVNVLAHELAHSWTGNLVTNATMNDFWLNEGFTVWAERRIHEALQGKQALSLAAALGRDSLQHDLDRFGLKSPYTRLKTDLAGVDPDDVYSQVPYEKGYLFVSLLEKTVGRKKFDKFVRDYTDRFAFTSITTEDFLAFLNEKLPGIGDEVGAKSWIYESGVPDNAPSINSRRLKELNAIVAHWSKGERPEPKVAKSWPVDEWLVVLAGLPKKQAHEELAWLDSKFHFNDSGNAEILCKWLVMAATSNYAPAFPKLKAFLGRVGRMKFLKPIYQALADSPETKPLALAIFGEHAARYHPIARGGLEKQLKG